MHKVRARFPIKLHLQSALIASVHPRNNHSSPCRPHRVIVPRECLSPILVFFFPFSFSFFVHFVVVREREVEEEEEEEVLELRYDDARDAALFCELEEQKE